jgi:hypothetical protein
LRSSAFIGLPWPMNSAGMSFAMRVSRKKPAALAATSAPDAATPL